MKDKLKNILKIVFIALLVINTIFISFRFSLESKVFLLEIIGAIWLVSLGIIKGVQIVINKYVVFDSKDLPKK